MDAVVSLHAFAVKSLNGVDYEVQVFMEKRRVLIVEVYHPVDRIEWHAQFSEECGPYCFFFCTNVTLDIEELTRKTGNFKSLDTFFAMLVSAIREVGGFILLNLNSEHS